MPIIAEFVRGVAQASQLPTDRLPEIALAGRSNVGKSSLINRVLGREGLAHTSNTPGRTQQLNFYRVWPEGKAGPAFYLVDMPGYGHAEVSLVRRRSWAQLIDDYLSTRAPLRGVIHLIDMRHPPQPLDLEMSSWLRHFEHHFLVVATKADKIAKTKVPEATLQVAERLNVDSDDVVAFSAQNGLGRDIVWRWMRETAGRAPDNNEPRWRRK
jgi:GTP-binding protein